jgi:hypothetical protein
MGGDAGLPESLRKRQEIGDRTNMRLNYVRLFLWCCLAVVAVLVAATLFGAFVPTPPGR